MATKPSKTTAKKSATKSASKSIAVAKPTGTAIANIDQELAQDVANIKSQIGQSSSKKISVAVTGDFILPGDVSVGNEIQVVVVDFASRNNFYINPYDPNNPTPPDCYAMNKVINDMAPEDDSPEKQNEECLTCPMNAWGSGNGGKGKACQNRRYVAVLVVDPEDPEAHNAPDAPIYLLDLSPSNIKFFDGAVNSVSRSLGHPIKAIFTIVGKNAGTYATVTWHDPEPNPDYASHAQRRGEVQDMLYRRPDFAAAAAKQQQKPAARGRTTPRRAAARR